MGGQSKQKRKITNKMDAKLDQLIASLQEMTAKAAESEPEAPPAVYHPPHSDIGFFGYTCLLVGAICMAVSTLYFYMKAMNAKPGARKFEVITMLVTGIATVLYMTMFSGAGYGYVKELGHDINPHDTVDQFFYGRYIDWLLTTPLMIWDVLNIAGASTDDILMAVGVDVLMIAFGAVGAQTPSAQKWLFFICGMVCFCHIVGVLLRYTKVNTYGAAAQALYCRVAYLTIVLWCLYPLVWIVAEGARLVSPSLEAFLYMLMDVSAKCVFGFIIVQARPALEAIQGAEA